MTPVDPTALPPAPPLDGPVQGAPQPWQPLSAASLLAGLRRRLALVVGLPLAVAIASLALDRAPAERLQAQLSFAIDIPASALVAGSDEGSAAKVGEALIDDISRIIRGDRFAAAVQARLDGVDVVPGESASSLSADDRHRVADVTVTRMVAGGPDGRARAEAELMAIAEAVVAELEANGDAWFARLGADDVALTIVDGPRVVALGPTLRERLALPLRGLLSALVALGMAGGLHLADRRLYAAREVEHVLMLPVLAQIPRRLGTRSGA